MSRKRALGGVGFLVTVLVLAACGGGPDAKYVSNAKAGLYLKIPTSWETVDLQAGDVKPDGPFATPEAWRVGIDSAAEPSRSHFEDSAPDEPNGLVEVIPIDPAQLSTAPSLQMLRDLATGTTTDPSTGQTETAQVDLLRDEEVTMSSGHWGLRTTVQSTDDPRVRLEQLAMFDPAIHRLYRVMVNCTTTCFDAHEQEIESIFDSVILRGTS